MKVAAFYVGLWWSRFLDLAKPQRDYTGRRYPRIETLTGEAAARAKEIIAKHERRRTCQHDWEYMERKPGETYTGYCERCIHCGEIAQIAQ